MSVRADVMSSASFPKAHADRNAAGTTATTNLGLAGKTAWQI
jgi:hypothetical protein